MIRCMNEEDEMKDKLVIVLAVLIGFMILALIYINDSSYKRGYAAGQAESPERQAIFSQGYSAGYDTGFNEGFTGAYGLQEEKKEN